MRRRLASQGGFGVVELLIAMTVMVVAIMALVAVLNSGMVTLRRAADTSTAAAVADAQMEAYHALPNCAIYLEESTIFSAGPSYTGVPAYPATQIVAGIDATTPPPKTLPPPLKSSSPTCHTPFTTTTTAQQQLLGADGRSYWVNTYMTLWSPTTQTDITMKGSVPGPIPPSLPPPSLPPSGNLVGDAYVVAGNSIWIWDTTNQWVKGSVARKVTLAVRNPDDTKTLIRQTSTFTPPTGCNNGTHGPVSVGC